MEELFDGNDDNYWIMRNNEKEDGQWRAPKAYPYHLRESSFAVSCSDFAVPCLTSEIELKIGISLCLL